MQNPGQARESFQHFALWLAALFLTASGAQLWVVWLYGSPIPIWDQWYQAEAVFRPWLEGHLRWEDLMGAYSNHKIVITHLFDMGGIWLNGRWDPLLQMTLNAFLHAAFACGLALCLWIFSGRQRGGLVCCLLAPFFALPYAGENAIWGINSLWYFINLFALATIAGLGFEPANRWRWWLGLAAASLGLFTMASGWLAPLTAGGLILLRAIKNRRMGSNNAITLGLCAVLSVVGMMMVATQEHNRPLSAHSFAEFAAALDHNLNWPFDISGMALVIALPLVLLLIFYLRPNFPATREAELVLALALWSALQSIVIAYGRGHYVLAVLASRYMDVFNIFVVASLFAAVLLGRCRERERGARWQNSWLPLLFAGVIFFGLCRTSSAVVNDVLEATRQWNLIAEERVEAFLGSGDEKELFQKPTVRPDPKVTLRVLRDPKLQTILPPVCLPQTPPVAPGRFTAASQRLLKSSRAILSCGLILFVSLCAYGLLREISGLSFGKPAGIFALLIGLAALGFVWSKHDLRRDRVERELRQQLSAYFKYVNQPERAAIHQRKADAANSANQFAN
jgi:hypothetical protein